MEKTCCQKQDNAVDLSGTPPQTILGFTRLRRGPAMKLSLPVIHSLASPVTFVASLVLLKKGGIVWVHSLVKPQFAIQYT